MDIVDKVRLLLAIKHSEVDENMTVKEFVNKILKEIHVERMKERNIDLKQSEQDIKNIVGD